MQRGLTTYVERRRDVGRTHGVTDAEVMRRRRAREGAILMLWRAASSVLEYTWCGGYTGVYAEL